MTSSFGRRGESVRRWHYQVKDITGPLHKGGSSPKDDSWGSRGGGCRAYFKYALMTSFLDSHTAFFAAVMYVCQLKKRVGKRTDGFGRRLMSSSRIRSWYLGVSGPLSMQVETPALEPGAGIGVVDPLRLPDVHVFDPAMADGRLFSEWIGWLVDCILAWNDAK